MISSSKLTRAGAAALVAAAILSLNVSRAAAAAESPPEAEVGSKLAQHFPEIKIEGVRPAPWAGLFEVITPTEIVYTNADASLLFAGRILDTHTKADLTQQRWDEAHAIDFDTLPFDLAIKTVRGDGSRKLAVFSDPDCPYCQRLERQFKDVTNVTIFTFLYPVESLHPGAAEKATRIWCSADRAAAWTSWMVAGTKPATDACTTPAIASLLDLGNKLKIGSTPTLFFGNGRRIGGLISNDRLERELEASQPQKAAAAGR